MDYIQGLTKLYCVKDENNLLTANEQAQCLKTLKDFSSISKTVKLSNLFLTSFAEIVAQHQNSNDHTALLLQLDVLIALMDQVKLKKENYIEVMRGVRLFVTDKQTQKKGYKILAKVIDKFELSNLAELVEIKTEITPMMKGQATK